MKVISANNITSISADSENANYPAENVLDNHPKRPWKADGDYQATLTADISSMTDIAIFATNAQSAQITITDPNAIEWEAGVDWEAGVEWDNIEISQPVTSLIQQGSAYALWSTIGVIDAPVTAEILLTTTTDQTLYAGIVVAGDALEFPNPKYGLGEMVIDYSISIPLSNGSEYYKKRELVRQFSGILTVERDNYFYSFVSSVIRDNGSVPLAWQITDGGDNWVVYGKANMPSGVHQYYRHSDINFTITEVV